MTAPVKTPSFINRSADSFLVSAVKYRAVILAGTSRQPLADLEIYFYGLRIIPRAYASQLDQGETSKRKIKMSVRANNLPRPGTVRLPHCFVDMDRPDKYFSIRHPLASVFREMLRRMYPTDVPPPSHNMEQLVDQLETRTKSSANEPKHVRLVKKDE